MIKGYINLDGEIIHTADYIIADRFYEDYALVQTENGFNHLNLQFLSPYQKYKWLTRFYSGWAGFETFEGQKGF